MKLYYAPGACSQAVHIALREAGLPFGLEKVDLRARKTETGADWNLLNPKGYVPLLELDDGARLTEAAALLTYVADHKPDAQLAPAPTSMERYRLQEWLTFISSEIHKTFGPLFNPVFPDDAKTINKERVRKRFEYVDQQLAGRQFLMGDRFTVADAYLFVMLGWAEKFAIDLSDLPAVQVYRARLASRPAVQQALQAEGLS